jgi:hypothetical protein
MHRTFAVNFQKVTPSVTLENIGKMKINENKLGFNKRFTISLQKF